MEEVQLGEKKPNILRRIYGKQYKYLMIVSFAILILAISQLSYQMIATGSPFEKSVDLKGGIILEVNRQYNPIELEKFLIEQYPKNDINVRLSADKLIIEADIAPENEAELVSTVEKKVGKLTEDDYSSTLIGPVAQRVILQGNKPFNNNSIPVYGHGCFLVFQRRAKRKIDCPAFNNSDNIPGCCK